MISNTSVIPIPSGASRLTYTPVWKCSGELRWFEFIATRHVDEDFVMTTKEKKLQQAWLEFFTHEVEWRDVPTVQLP